MKLKRLKVFNFRNIPLLDFKPSSNFNVIYGNNGSGKTSVLETISYLGYGRSFRSSKFQSLIKDEEDYFAINAEVTNDDGSYPESLSIVRYRKSNQSTQIKINSESTKKISDLVDKVSVQVIHPQSIDLILQGPELRRNYLDWGIYYSDNSFKSIWSSYKKILTQRNTLLKAKAPLDNIQIWDDMYASLCETISDKRQNYLNELTPILNEKLSLFLPQYNFKFLFQKGWENGLPLRTVLDSNIEKERILGYTLSGCHRADLKVKCNDFNASEILSRGQLKLLICAMKLAQGFLLKKQLNKNCIYLIDDISSELDEKSKSVLLTDLKDSDNQVFLTNISNDISIPNAENNLYMDISEAISSMSY